MGWDGWMGEGRGERWMGDGMKVRGGMVMRGWDEIGRRGGRVRVTVDG